MQSLFSRILVLTILAAFFVVPGEVSAQLFGRFRDNPRSESNNGAKSQLPNPGGAISANHYGPAPTVSDEIRAEVSGSIPVRPAPDFRVNPNAVSNYQDVPKLQRVMTPAWYKGGMPETPPRIKPLVAAK